MRSKLYLCCVKDAFSGRIVGYSMDARMKASLAVAALRNAIQLRRPLPATPPWSRSSLWCRTTCSTSSDGTREELRLAIVSWIERTYHRRRRQRALGRLTPIEIEAIHEVARAA
jgi:putative transposase